MGFFALATSAQAQPPPSGPHQVERPGSTPAQRRLWLSGFSAAAGQHTPGQWALLLGEAHGGGAEGAAPRPPDGPRRWALLIGENHGLGGEETLRYAQLDAQRVRDTLVDVGRVSPTDVTLLQGASADAARASLGALQRRLTAEAGPHDQLFVYISSHAGDGVLHLDGTELPLVEVVDFVKQAPVEVGVLVVDACRSGAMLRLKGLKPVDGPPVHVEASTLRGRVLISASGADEYAQESDELASSYFTHHFLTGLRGAADVSRDGRVTLDEVYAWAWARTLESTFGSRGGVQRPSFRVDLAGQGELVLSEPGRAAGRLTIAVTAPGRWLVVDARTGGVVADLDKPQGPLTLALPPGAYRVRLRVERGLLERALEVPSQGGITVGDDELERAALTRVALKGGPTEATVISVAGTVATSLVAGVVVQPGLDLRARWDGQGLGVVDELAVGLTGRDARSTLSGFRQSELELRVAAAHRFLFSRVTLSVGVELGALLVLQSDVPSVAQPTRTSLGGLAQAVGEVRVPIVRPVELVLSLTGGAALVRKDTVVVLPRGTANLGLAVSF